MTKPIEANNLPIISKEMPRMSIWNCHVWIIFWFDKLSFKSIVMQGWESDCWLDLAKGGWVGGIALIELKNPRFSFHA